MIKKYDIEELKDNVKILYCKIDVMEDYFNSRKIVKSFDGYITSGNYSISADSDVRRTCSLTVCLNDGQIFNESELYNCALQINIGYFSYKDNEIKYYSLGIYVFDKQSFVYDVNTNELSLNMIDLIGLFDKEHKGTLPGALKYVIRATDEKTGERLPHEQIVLKNNVIKWLNEIGIKNYRVDGIGVYGEVDQEEYKWDEIPYDIELSCESSYIDLLNHVRDLYPFYEYFFDVDGNFIFQKIPVTDNDQIMLNSNDVADLVVKETVDRNIYDIKNVVEVWGKDYNIDDGRMGDGIYHDGIYQVTFENYTESGYSDGMKIALKVDRDNTASVSYISVNNLTPMPIYKNSSKSSGVTSIPIDKGVLIAGQTYIFKYSTSIHGFYYLGGYQIHAVSLLVNEYPNDTTSYKNMFGTDNMSFIVDINTPYSIEKIGTILKVYNGDKYSNIDSQYNALNYAETKLNQLSRRTTSLSLEMLSVPWLDVNQKIQYQPHNEDYVKTYVTKSISGDLVSGTISVNLMEFYPTLDVEN